MRKIKKIKKWVVKGYAKDGTALGEGNVDAFDRKGAVKEAQYFNLFGKHAVKITAYPIK